MNISISWSLVTLDHLERKREPMRKYSFVITLYLLIYRYNLVSLVILLEFRIAK